MQACDKSIIIIYNTNTAHDIQCTYIHLEVYVFIYILMIIYITFYLGGLLNTKLIVVVVLAVHHHVDVVVVILDDVVVGDYIDPLY